jgi:type VI secretion system FHA domain protein
MAIKLRVISDQYRDLGENRSRVFGVNGGTVGRAPDNDWILPDSKRVVSGHHFEVQYHGGAYWLKDTSTNGVFVNESDDPAADQGRVELRDGDRLRVGDYEILVSVDNRSDFLPAAADEHSAAKHMDTDIGHQLDLDSLLRPRDAEQSGSVSIRNAFGVRVPSEARASLQRTAGEAETSAGTEFGAHARDNPPSPQHSRSTPEIAVVPASSMPAASPASAPNQDWALRTRPISKEDLAEALARRQSRVDARERSVPFHQQASTWADLRSAVQALCRGAGIDANSLSPEAQAMLPLVAGQLLREAVVGLNDIAQARQAATITSKNGAAAPVTAGSSNPLRTSSSVDQAIQRLFESHGRLHGGPVDSLRDVLQEAKDHEAAMLTAMRSALKSVLDQLAPANVADQFEHGRARTLAPGQDPRPKYWDHYSDFYRLITQQGPADDMPHPFIEAYAQEYARARAELKSKKSD